MRPRHWEATALQAMYLLSHLMPQFRQGRGGCPDFAPAGLMRTSLAEHLLTRGFGPPCETDAAIRVFACYAPPHQEQVIRCVLGEPGRSDAGRVAARACLASLRAAAVGGEAIKPGPKGHGGPPYTRFMVVAHANRAAMLFAVFMLQAPPQLLQFAAREGTAALALGFLSTAARPHAGVRRPQATTGSGGGARGPSSESQDQSGVTAAWEASSHKILEAFSVAGRDFSERATQDDLDDGCATLLRILAAESADPRGVLDAGAVPDLLALLGTAAPDRDRRGGAGAAAPRPQLSEGQLSACDNAAWALLFLSRGDACLAARAARQVRAREPESGGPGSGANGDPSCSCLGRALFYGDRSSSRIDRRKACTPFHFYRCR